MTSVHNNLSDLHNSADHTFMYESRIQLLGYIVSATTRNNRDNRRMTHTIFVALETSAVNESRGVREFRAPEKCCLFQLVLREYCISWAPCAYSFFEKGCRKKSCTRQSREVIMWDTINSLFLTL